MQELRRLSTMVFQNYNLFRNKTALENVMAGLTIVQKQSKAEARDAAEHYLDLVGMGDRMNHYPSQLSGGPAAASRHCPGAGIKAPCDSV